MPTVKTGKVVKVTSDPRGFTLHVPEPAPNGTDIPYTPVSSDQLTVASAAYVKGSDADVEGDPPACAKVTAR